MENRLIAAILIQAVKDWRQPQYRREVEKFVESTWFDLLAEALELDQNGFRRKLLGGKVAEHAMRAAYRNGKINP
jgi:hypothetical protein